MSEKETVLAKLRNSLSPFFNLVAMLDHPFTLKEDIQKEKQRCKDGIGTVRELLNQLENEQ